MASLPGGLGLERHVAGEMRSKAVSASLGRLCMVGWLRADSSLGGLWFVPGEVLVEIDSEVVVSGKYDIRD